MEASAAADHGRRLVAEVGRAVTQAVVSFCNQCKKGYSADTIKEAVALANRVRSFRATADYQATGSAQALREGSDLRSLPAGRVQPTHSGAPLSEMQHGDLVPRTCRIWPRGGQKSASGKLPGLARPVGLMSRTAFPQAVANRASHNGVVPTEPIKLPPLFGYSEVVRYCKARYWSPSGCSGVPLGSEKSAKCRNSGTT
jgi:hypothetical protein